MGTDAPKTSVGSTGLYFFPGAEVSRADLEAILGGDDRRRKAWAISHLLRYAVWDDIWQWTSRDQVRDLFGDLDLPANLRTSLARMLKIDAEVMSGR
jgi:hypothetical protein